MTKNLTNKINEELASYSKAEAINYCSDLNNYTVENRSYPILSHQNDGIRKVYIPKDLNQNKNVQYARTVSDLSNFQELDNKFQQYEEIGHNDVARIWEIENFFSIFADIENKRQDGKTIFPKKFCEIGFRHLKLMKYYEEKHSVPACGFDICDVSVKYANHKGYEAECFDLNYISPENNIDLSGSNLVMCYHVLEHVVDPLHAIKNIFDAMDDLTVFHVEVPLENTPNVKYGHVFPFHKQDLPAMLSSVGFDILGLAYHQAPGYAYERVIAIKNFGSYNRG